MVLLGVLVDAFACALGGVLGAFLKQRVSKKMGNFLMVTVALCLMLMGVQGMVQATNTLLTTIEMILGAALGFSLDIDKRIRCLGDRLQMRLKTHCTQSSLLCNIAEGFVDSALIVCVGSMAIVGSLNSGLLCDHTVFFTKGLVDFVINTLLAASLGIGVALSGLAVFVYQGILTLSAHWVAPLLTQAVIHEMMVTGALLLFALGLDMAGAVKIKVANLIPACFIPIILVPLFKFLGM